MPVGPVESAHLSLPSGGYQLARNPISGHLLLIPTTNIEVVDRSGVWSGYLPSSAGSAPVQQIVAQQPQPPAPFSTQLITQSEFTKRDGVEGVMGTIVAEQSVNHGPLRDHHIKQDVRETKTIAAPHQTAVATIPIGPAQQFTYPAFTAHSAQPTLSYFYESSPSVVQLAPARAATPLSTEMGKRSQGTSPLNPVTPSPPLHTAMEQGIQVSEEGMDDLDEDSDDSEGVACGETTQVKLSNRGLGVTTAIQVDLDAQTMSDENEFEERTVEVTDSGNQTEPLLSDVSKEELADADEVSCQSADATEAVVECPTTLEPQGQEVQVSDASVGAEDADSAPVLPTESKPVMDFIDHHGLDLLVDSIEEFAAREQEDPLHPAKEGIAPCEESIDENQLPSCLLSPDPKSQPDASESEKVAWDLPNLVPNIDPSCTDGLGLLCALAEQRFMEESMGSNLKDRKCSQSFDIKQETTDGPAWKQVDINSNYHLVKNELSASPAKNESGSCSSSSKGDSPLHLSPGGPSWLETSSSKCMDPSELEMRIQLAELQRKYKEKQRELAKLQPKQEKETLEKQLIRRGPGRPRKRRLFISKSQTLLLDAEDMGPLSPLPVACSGSPVSDDDQSQHSWTKSDVPPLLSPKPDSPLSSPELSVAFIMEPLLKKKKERDDDINTFFLHNHGKLKRDEKLGLGRNVTELDSAMTKVDHNPGEFEKYQVASLVTLPCLSPNEDVPTPEVVSSLVSEKVKKHEQKTPGRLLKTKRKPLSRSKNSRKVRPSQGKKSRRKSLKPMLSLKSRALAYKALWDQGKVSAAERRKNTSSNASGKKRVGIKPDLKRVLANMKESKKEPIHEAIDTSGLGLLAQFASQVASQETTPVKGMKRKAESVSENDTSDSELSPSSSSSSASSTSSKKRKPGRPKKHVLTQQSKTPVSKQPKKLTLLKDKVQTNIKTKKSKTANSATKKEQEQKGALFDQNAWNRRRSERIFLHDAGVTSCSSDFLTIDISSAQGPSVTTSPPTVASAASGKASGGNLPSVNSGSKQSALSPSHMKNTASTHSPSWRSDGGSKVCKQHTKAAEATGKARKKLKPKKEIDSSPPKKCNKNKDKETKKQTRDKSVPDELFTALKKCRLSESNIGGMSPVNSDSDNVESSYSEGENLPLSTLIDRTPPAAPSGLRVNTIQPEDLKDNLRVLTMEDGLFYAGFITAIRAPDVYGITLDGERGNRPHIYSREEILQETILEVKPSSLDQLQEGTRVCAYWSQQYRCLYPGTVAKATSPNPFPDKTTVYVEFDDGDSGRIPIEDIRCLPTDYPIVSIDPNPLLLLGKRRSKSTTDVSSSEPKLVSDPVAAPMVTDKGKSKKTGKQPGKASKKKTHISKNDPVEETSPGDVFEADQASASSMSAGMLDVKPSLTETVSPKKERKDKPSKKKSKKKREDTKGMVKLKEKGRVREKSTVTGKGTSSSVSGTVLSKTKKRKKHKDDKHHHRHHHHHHCHHRHHHHHHKKKKHDKSNDNSENNNLSSTALSVISTVIPDTSQVATVSSKSPVVELPTNQPTAKPIPHSDGPSVVLPESQQQADSASSITEVKKSELTVKIKTHIGELSPVVENTTESNQDNEKPLVESSLESSESSVEGEDHVIEDSDQVTKAKPEDSKLPAGGGQKKPAKKRKERLPSVEKSKIAAFLPARQLWRWSGKSFRRPGTKGKAKKEFYKAITRGKELIQVGDCAVFLSTGRPHLPFIGRIETMWQSWGGNMVVRVKWFYHPEETKGNHPLKDPRGALFQSPHVDENDVQTISHKCEVLCWAEYIKFGNQESNQNSKRNILFDNNDVYYLAGSYDPLTAVVAMDPDVEAFCTS